MSIKRTTRPRASVRRPVGRPGASRIGSRTVAYLAGFLFVTTLCSILYLNQASKADALLQEIRTKELESSVLRRENALSREAMARLGNLASMNEWVRKLNLVPMDSPIYVRLSYSPSPLDATSTDAAQGTGEVSQGGTGLGEPSAIDGDSPGPEAGPVDLRGWLQSLLRQFEAWLHEDSILRSRQ